MTDEELFAATYAQRTPPIMLLMKSKSIHSDNLRNYLEAMERAVCHKEISDNERRAEGYLACLFHTGLIDPGQYAQAHEVLKRTHEKWKAGHSLGV
ncbi:hypothetical protein [Pseudomonas typographi]|uniref:Uncharacterized protein n=1 Tax=Pseudomonas typographi TaxID=2715964 RepID=A0ABR7Z1A5_9PSED|nr:hypothetical protein [Pseudomonas typographi]MBD1551703.1 hypothetical protein [Pseudomonas typographi]MBD1587042.1 hypothetical protein [Pseudomonas typographi]MBD1599281.1 hypothetical protein [Pseudomonas typographi]